MQFDGEKDISTPKRGRPPVDPQNPLKSIAYFSKEYGVPLARIKKAIDNGELIWKDKKIDIRDPKNKEFLESWNEQLQKQEAKNPREVRASKKSFPASFVNASRLAEILGVDSHAVAWRTDKTFYLIKDSETGLYDIEEPHNKFFITKFLEGVKKESELRTFYIPANYSKLQSLLGNIPLQYCLDNGLLIKNEEGMIDLFLEHNRMFLEKVKKKEITINDFKLTITDFRAKCHIGILTYRQEVRNGNIILDENGRIDINHPLNKKFIDYSNNKTRSRKLSILPDGFVSRKTFAEMLGVDSQVLQNHFASGYIIRDESGAIDIRNPINKYFLDNYEKGKRFKPMDPEERAKYLSEGASQRNVEYISQVKLGELLGLQQPTVYYHIKEGHIKLDEHGKIDLNHPDNIKFIESYRRGEAFSTAESSKGIKTPKKAEVPVVKKVRINPNICMQKFFADICGISHTNLVHHIDKGRVIRDADGGIDLSNPKNKAFVEKCRQEKI